MLSNQCNLSNLKQPVKEPNPASRYALQVALQTMKERCQKLQNRLSCLEDENLQLRVEKHRLSGPNKSEVTPSDNLLEKKVTELNKLKSQLSHHIVMVASENKVLWQRLSKLTEEKELSGKFTLSDTPNKQIPRTLKPDASINIVDLYCNKGKEGKEESLEEVSLKGLNSLIKAKTVENNNDEASEVQNGSVSLDQCGFTLDSKEDKEEPDESSLAEIKELLEKMKADKELLKQQQEGLKKAIAAFKKISTDGVPCRRCMSRDKESDSGKLEVDANEGRETMSGCNSLSGVRGPLTDESAGFDLPQKEDQYEVRVCPLCQQMYPKNVHPNDFNEHVISHFVEEETEDSILGNFEDDFLDLNPGERKEKVIKTRKFSLKRVLKLIRKMKRFKAVKK